MGLFHSELLAVNYQRRVKSGEEKEKVRIVRE